MEKIQRSQEKVLRVKNPASADRVGATRGEGHLKPSHHIPGHQRDKKNREEEKKVKGRGGQNPAWQKVRKFCSQ